MPAVKWGQYNDKLPDDISGWNKFDEIAVVLGRISDIVALDIDTDDAAIIKSIEDFVGVSPVKKIGSKGFTAFYRYNDEKTKSWGGVVEILSNKHLTTIPPSKHREKDLHYTWQGQELIGADLPYLPPDFYEFMEGMYPSPVRDVPLYHYQYNDATLDEVAGALNYISPDCNREQWVKIGMALRDYFGDTAYGLWHEWSKKSSKYKALDAHHAWKSYNDKGITIATLFMMASDNHWERPRTDRPEVDTSITENIVGEAVGKRAASPKKPEFSFDPMKIDGLIGDTVRWIVRDTLLPQPMLALLNTLAFAGSVFGRKYASPLDTRSNIYFIGVADTGAGKDNSRKKIGKLAEAAGLGDFVGAHSIRSDTGMVRSLQKYPCQLLMLDEFGKFLQALTDNKASPHNKAVIRAFMQLYGDSAGVYKHGDYANPKVNESIVIHNPNLCIYGTTTEGEYLKALSYDAVKSGELNRMIAIKVPTVERVRVTCIPFLEPELVDRWNLFAPNSLGGILNDASLPPEPTIVEWGDCDDLQWEIGGFQYDAGRNNPQTAALWNRRHENIIKIAMIFAIARNKTLPEFKKVDFDIAKSIVDASIHYMCNLIGENLAENDYEKSYVEILEFFKQNSPNPITRTQLFKRFRKFKRKDMDEFISSMIEQEIVIAERESGKTKPILTYKLKE